MKGGSPKVTTGDVLEMRIKASQGVSTKDLAQRYDMSVVTIRSIIAHRIWKHVGGPLTQRKAGTSKLTREQVEFIFNSKATGVALAKQFNVTGGTISNIKNGKTFQNGHPGDLVQDLLETY
jgi:plasmid maintenance system antidote protein VapI